MRVIAMPRNGLGNRLQAMASAYTLAKRINAEYQVLWTEQPVFQASYSEVFSDLPSDCIINNNSNLATQFDQMPFFTQVNFSNKRITLRNLRLGDQRFSRKLLKILKSADSDSEIWIQSGEKFDSTKGRFFKDSPEFRMSRQEFYNLLKFRVEDCQDFRDKLSSLGGNFVAIHLRGTDRKSEVVSWEKLVRKIEKTISISDKTQVNLYIASDEKDRGTKLYEILKQKDFKVIFDSEVNRDRLTRDESNSSVEDWLILRNATKVISYGETTFSYEATVAGGTFENRIHIKGPILKRLLSQVKKELLYFKLYGNIPFTNLRMLRSNDH